MWLGQETGSVYFRGELAVIVLTHLPPLCFPGHFIPNWKDRYMVIVESSTGPYLQYFDSEAWQSSQPKGEIPLLGATVQDRPKPNEFDLITRADKKKYPVRCSSDKDFHEFKQKIQAEARK